MNNVFLVLISIVWGVLLTRWYYQWKGGKIVSSMNKRLHNEMDKEIKEINEMNDKLDTLGEDEKKKLFANITAKSIELAEMKGKVEGIQKMLS